MHCHLLFDFHSYLWATRHKQHVCMHKESPSVTVCYITLNGTCSGQLSAHLCVQLLYGVHPAASVKICLSPFILRRSPHEHLGVIRISLLELLQGVVRLKHTYTVIGQYMRRRSLCGSVAPVLTLCEAFGQAVEQEGTVSCSRGEYL